MTGSFERVGTISRLSIYPVKGMARLDVRSARVLPWGLEHDRCWAIMAADGRILTQREIPALATIVPLLVGETLYLRRRGVPNLAVAQPGGRAQQLNARLWGDVLSVVDMGEAASEWLTEALGIATHLVWLGMPPAARAVDRRWGAPGDWLTFANGFPVHLCATASLRDLQRRLPRERLAMSRFRPNIVVTTSEAWSENSWSRVSTGEVDLEVAKLCSRCSVIGIEQVMGKRVGASVLIEALGALARDEDGRPAFGINLLTRAFGTLRVGDRLSAQGSKTAVPPRAADPARA